MSRRHTAKTAEPPPVAPPTTDDGVYWEGKVADALGIARDRVRAIRQEHLDESKHYRLVRGEVVLTEQGLARLNDLLSSEGKATSPAPAPPMVTFAVPAGPPARNRFQVVRVPANRHLLYCVATDGRTNGTQVLVRVKANENFMPKMQFEAIEAEHGTWQYRGRLPRRKGKW